MLAKKENQRFSITFRDACERTPQNRLFLPTDGLFGRKRFACGRVLHQLQRFGMVRRLTSFPAQALVNPVSDDAAKPGAQLGRLTQFGAIKAIGVTNARLIGMILLQAFTVGLIGFSIGTGMAAEFFNFFGQKLATRGIILMWQSVALTGGCMVFVMVLASILSLRRVLVLEPAIVFRG